MLGAPRSCSPSSPRFPHAQREESGSPRARDVETPPEVEYFDQKSEIIPRSRKTLLTCVPGAPSTWGAGGHPPR